MKSHQPRRMVLVTALAATLLISGTVVSLPAESQEATVATAEAPKAPVAIPAERIPAESDDTLARIAKIRERIPSDATAQDSQQFQELSASVEAFRERPDIRQPEKLPASRIVQLQRQAAFYAGRLDQVRQTIGRTATQLSSDSAELAGMRERWSATIAAAQDNALARPLIEEARRVLAAITDAERALDKPLRGTLQRRDRVEQHVRLLADTQLALDEATRLAATRSLEADSPPIWQVPELSARAVLEGTQQLWLDQWSFLQGYLRVHRRAVEAFVLLAGLFTVLLLWMTRRPGWTASAAADLPDAGRLLRRPYSAIALLLLLGALLAARNAPAILTETLAVAMLIPLIRLAPVRLVAGHPAVLYGLAALVLLARPRSLLPFDSLAYRLDLLLVGLFGLAGLVWLLRMSRRQPPPSRSWLALVARITPVLVVLTAGAVLANVLGNVSLAELLTHGSLAVVYVSAILYAAAVVTQQLLSLFVRTRLGRSMRMVTHHGETMIGSIQAAVGWVAIGLWVWASLAVFGLWDPVVDRLGQAMERTWNLGELEISMGGVLAFVVGVVLALYVSRAIRFVLNEEILVRLPWPAGAKSTTATLVYYAVLAGGLLMAFAAAGVETTQFAIIAGALGVGIGFGLQNVVNNFVSGLILMFERPIQPGDIIDVDTLQGRVVEIGLRATRIKTWEGAEVVVPNGTLLSGNLINWTLSDSTRRIDVNVGVAYGSDVRKVLEVLTAVARRQPLAMEDPEPTVVFSGFGDSSLNFTVRFWIRDANTVLAARTGGYVDVYEALAAAGIEIPFPQRDLHLRSVDARAAGALAGRPQDPASRS
jgi:potassium efflux system protein